MAEPMEKPGSSSGKSVTSSFRISAEVYEILQKDAMGKNISLNSLVNHLLRRYSEFDMYMTRFKGVALTLRTFGNLMDNVGDDALTQIGSLAGAEVPKAMISAMYGQANLENAIKFLKLIAAHAANWRYSEAPSEGGTTVVLAHDLGHKGSVFFSNYFDSMFKVMGISPQISQTDQSVILRF